METNFQLSTNEKLEMLKDNAIPKALCEFFKVIIHNILYHRGIFPKSTFTKRKAYGLSVYHFSHPKLNRYISKTFRAVLFHLQNKTLERIILGITVNKVPIEKYKIVIYKVNEDLIKYGSDSLEHVFQKFCLIIRSAVETLEDVPKEAGFYINLMVTPSDVTPFSEEISYTHLKNLDDFHDFPIHLFHSKELKLHLLIQRDGDIIQD